MSDSANWAQPVDRLHVDEAQRDHAFNLEGKRVAGPQQGFGSLWDRRFTIALGTAVGAERLIADWRAHFGEFWPKGNTFYSGDAAIRAGDVTPLTASGATTGILVIYADETSFSYLTPEGHMLSGMITFSAREDAASGTVAEIRMLVRPHDPLIQLVWPVGRTAEGSMWRRTLENLAASYGVTGAPVTEHSVCVDRRMIWKNWRNVRGNVFFATFRHRVTHRKHAAS
ncbi:DUF1990 family protein [Microbacterium sp. ASV49]|uniref:DUF1990 family protein n=1 Tax=Microbacterium candidum TaxID=3041922 RepID=A0ABT7N2H1_9MICO|nr:DUF1990 family protein [Microbacterium sp. ASV49]MDL9980861.1 DUF1990 family protein [Microbacterium sp. ASV49]